MNNLVTINGVKGYVDENGTAHLSLDDVSRGLGFTQIKDGKEYVRWETVVGYLESFGFSQEVGKEGFIPESIFYRLAMKAKNEIAEMFQAKVADEILPSIRKTGAYLPAELSPQLQVLISMELKQKQLEARQEQVEQKLSLVKDTLIHRDENWRNWANRLMSRVAEADGGDYRQARAESYKLLEDRARCDLNTRARNLRSRLEEQGATKTKLDSVNKMDVIESDTRLKEIYTAIVKEMAIAHSVGAAN